MGIFLQKGTKDLIVLRLTHSVGRGKHNGLVIDEPDVSKSHASLSWLNNNWYLKDHSSNGTLINGELIIHESRKIEKGDVLQFGRRDETVFRLNNDDKPSSYLINKRNKESMILLHDAAHFPLEEPVVSFFKVNNQSWFLDDGTDEYSLVEGRGYFFNEEEWGFIENEPLKDTIIYREINKKLVFIFSISHDYEKVRLVLSDKNTECDFGQRVHNHLLLLLAREKIEDLKSGQSSDLLGWLSMEHLVDTLKKELAQPNIDQYHVNIMIHRIRKQFSNDLPFEANVSDLIERNNGMLRFRYDNIEITQPGVTRIAQSTT